MPIVGKSYISNAHQMINTPSLTSKGVGRFSRVRLRGWNRDSIFFGSPPARQADRNRNRDTLSLNSVNMRFFPPDVPPSILIQVKIIEGTIYPSQPLFSPIYHIYLYPRYNSLVHRSIHPRCCLTSQDMIMCVLPLDICIRLGEEFYRV